MKLKKYSRERIQFKKAIRTFIPVYEMLANMRMKIEAGRALLYETSIIVDIRDGIEEQIKLHPEKKNDLRDQLNDTRTMPDSLPRWPKLSVLRCVMKSPMTESRYTVVPAS
jgi:hypothetical protein